MTPLALGPQPRVSGLVLAGGQGARMGGRDKGLLQLEGRPIVAHVIERFAPQVDELLISANRNLDTYAGFGGRVVTDTLGTGPLAGLHAGLVSARYDVLASVPCDAPALPADLVARLWSALSEHRAELAVATTGGLAHPVFLLARKSVLPGLGAYLEAGGRKAGEWCAQSAVFVPFDDEADAFANLNAPEDFSAYPRHAREKSP